MWPIIRNYRASSFEPGRGSSWAWGRRTHVMGIINATQDSFSGDGIDGQLDKAVALANSFEACGIDVIDIGGASSRPGADPTPVEVEKSRVVPVVEAVRDAVDLPISIDTTWAVVAEAALNAGATMVNDITGFLLDPDLAPLVAQREVGAVAMHNQRGREHHDVIDDIVAGFNETLSVCEAAQIDASKLILDPGFGFGWSVAQNLEILRRLPELTQLELPLLIGTSRKSSIGTVLRTDLGERLFGTAATVAQAICAGIDVIRVHDGSQMREVVTMTDAIIRPE
ncbi:MAG: dihydropteroate synthase [Actinomycetota bacterium]|nr:dihydropteroate synthase [Actinomycetota bacterium]MEC9316401.1 dihydropteroate synthase [Actinomycetota bacterium]MED5552687.1 dihydropteroate synthase [Actinomycetota bacterium]MEE3140951.1 dihydropteroate synthase [Actinomycetota bacterium]MEE3187088.1 dihydropteroate synthase [Actinomycetota bacterium]